ncbi:hypothetical protein K1719_027416 [Acacia pycnantha]|nr:hypothetical protein K1719_027416 [Acacia pycnantha]
MGFGAEVVIAMAGLWGVFLRPIVLRYAAEITEFLRAATRRILREGTPIMKMNKRSPSAMMNSSCEEENSS